MKKAGLAKNIFICGFMASGKSRLGKNLAELMNAELVDLDALIQEKERKTIIEIFQQNGEDYFRKKERETLKEIIDTFHGIISLGGGALQDQQMVDNTKQNGILIFIDVPLEEIVERVYRRDHRPILFDKSGKTKSKQILFDELKTLYFHREKYYRQAHISLKRTDFSSAEEMAAAAINKIHTV